MCSWYSQPYPLYPPHSAFSSETTEVLKKTPVVFIGGNGAELYDADGNVLCNGAAVISDCFSGQIEFSDKHAQACINQTILFGKNNIGFDLSSLTDFTTEIIDSTIDYLNQSGQPGMIFGGVECLYNKLYEALIPSMLLDTGFGTWANYWTGVYEEDFDTALILVFGKEGSARRTEYAGLIEKIQRYRTNITATKGAAFKNFKEEYGVEIAAIVGYGLADMPIIEHYDETGDNLVGAQDASFGATTTGLFDTLSQSYIDERTAAGFGAYISPDGKIDASTGPFPDTTWYVKNKHHDYAGAVQLIGNYFTQYSNVKATDNEKGISQFLVFTKGVSGESVNMTEENMADGEWITSVVQKPTVKSFFDSLIRFFKNLFELLKKLFNGEINL